MKYYISDFHLFHENAIKFDHRPFESVQERHDDVSDYRYQQLFTEICDYKEIYDSVGKEKYGLVLSHYPIFSWKNMGRGKILLYGREEDQFYQSCLKQMQENDCRHVYDKKLQACNVGCMLPYMNYTPRILEEILEGVEMETK